MTDPIWEHLNALKRKMKIKVLFLLFLFLNFRLHSTAQDNSKQVSILFYNVENLFDVMDDPETDDDNYTQGGDLHWTSKRLNKKVLNISKVILGASGWDPPAIIGLCEIENRYVLEKLVADTPIRSIPYKIVHKESPDHRGIDVALLYNSEQIYPLEYNYFPILNTKKKVISTREILYFSGILNKLDTLHFFINHWPSRFSGLLETKEQRNAAARVLRDKIDELFLVHNNSKIIILGDFNDNPDDENIAEILGAKGMEEPIVPGEIYNLSFKWQGQETGTLKYQSQWYFFDQIIVSGSLVKNESGYTTTVQDAKIIDLPFLIERDERYGGQKPKRTYYGYSYNDGFSDHLPVLLKLNAGD